MGEPKQLELPDGEDFRRLRDVSDARWNVITELGDERLHG